MCSYPELASCCSPQYPSITPSVPTTLELLSGSATSVCHFLSHVTHIFCLFICLSFSVLGIQHRERGSVSCGCFQLSMVSTARFIFIWCYASAFLWGIAIWQNPIHTHTFPKAEFHFPIKNNFANFRAMKRLWLSFPAPLPQKSLGVGAVIQSQQDILHGNTLWHCWSSKGKTGFGSTIGKESSSNLKIEPSIPVLCMAMWIRHLKKKCAWAIILLSQFYSKSESVSRLVVSDSSRPHGL